MNWKVYAYGSPQPDPLGVEIVACADERVANTVADALALKYIEQWFGVVRPDGEPGKPFRYRREVAL